MNRNHQLTSLLEKIRVEQTRLAKLTEHAHMLTVELMREHEDFRAKLALERKRPKAPKIYRCVICGENRVNPWAGFDTCKECSARV